MIQYTDFIKKLDSSQQAAATISGNAVIAAGAGSGKTKVLSSRYIHLIIEKGLHVDEILTLTFTKKAAIEMQTRIYRDLCTVDHPAARQAVRDFYKSQIATIDSFCTSIVKQGCRQFGISPDYTIDNTQALQLAKKLALPFLLEHRNHSSIKNFLQKHTISQTADGFLAEPISRYATVSRPLSVLDSAKRQGTEIARFWKKTISEVTDLANFFMTLGTNGSETQKTICNSGSTLNATSFSLTFDESAGEFGTFFVNGTAIPNDDTGIPSAIEDVLNRYTEVLLDFKGTTRSYASVFKNDQAMKEAVKRFRDETIVDIISAINYVEARHLVVDALLLLNEFQTQYLTAKRVAGTLTFADIAQLAVDILKADPALRAEYKKQLKSIMIDEFQDDNELQRDLLFLLAEDTKYNDVIPHDATPDKARLSSDKLFFVGDEKQSIYRFRGADVSVFRRLSVDLGISASKPMPSLDTNYRTQKKLIDAFNTIFPDMFLSGSNIQAYEATFNNIIPFRDTAGITPEIELFAVNELHEDKSNPSLLTAKETESFIVAQRIKEMVDSKMQIFDRKAECTRAVTWSDIVILFRTKTNQHYIERYLRLFDIPYAAENQRGLFSDAPINDMYNMMRLAIYPRDVTAYAALLRSPFVSMSDSAVVTILALAKSGNGAEQPFSPIAEASLTGKDKTRFIDARELYATVCSMIDNKPLAEIITYLWYDSGYRYQIVSRPDLAMNADLYDFFYEMARKSDAQNVSAAQFLDSVAEMMGSPSEIEDMSIPITRQAGVTLMTVHKSKGLEFPVVFIMYCGGKSGSSTNTDLVYLTDDFGITVNTTIPVTKQRSNKKENQFFFTHGGSDDGSKATAELRRLMYVAMTRAENTVVLVGSGKFDTPGKTSVTQLSASMYGDVQELQEERDTPDTFFDTIFYALNQHPDIVRSKEIWPPLRSSIYTGVSKSPIVPYPIEKTAKVYENTPVVMYPEQPRTIAPASMLHLLMTENSGTQNNDAQNVTQSCDPNDPIDKLLDGSGLTAAHFGTIVHALIEATITKKMFVLPPEISARLDDSTAKRIITGAQEFADRFFASKLASNLNEATDVQSEYSLKTLGTLNGREIVVSGQIDLMFKTANSTVYIVDFKTDRVENPEIHVPQLTVYKKAAKDLYPDCTIKGFLFYVRSGNSVEV